MPNVRADNLHDLIEKHASAKSDFMTDEAQAFTGIGWNFASHGTVQHSKDEYVRKEWVWNADNTELHVISVHSNTIEGFFSILKRGIYGVYQHVSEAHLHRYLSEFDFRYSNRVKMGIDDVQRTEIAVRSAKGKRLLYRDSFAG